MSDPYRINKDYTATTPMNKLVREPPEEFLASYIAGENLGIDTVNRRFPQRPIDDAFFAVYMSDELTIKRMAAAYYKNFFGCCYQPAFSGDKVQVARKGCGAHLLLPAGSVAVTYGHKVMCDPTPAYDDDGFDVVRQWTRKEIRIRAPAACTAAINQPVTAPLVGDTTLTLDTISVNYGLKVGDTLRNTTVGGDGGVVIKSITYLTAVTATITCSPIPADWATLADNDALTNVHGANLWMIPNPEIDAIFGNIKSIIGAAHFDFLVGTTVTVLRIITTGAAAAGEIRLRTEADGTQWFDLGTAVTVGDELIIDAEVYDDDDHIFTVGQAIENGAVRTGTGDANASFVEVVLI